MTTELITNGARLLHINRRRVSPIGGLTESQLAWCRSKWPWFEHNRVVRLADHERCAAAYRIAELIEDSRSAGEVV